MSAPQASEGRFGSGCSARSAYRRPSIAASRGGLYRLNRTGMECTVPERRGQALVTRVREAPRSRHRPHGAG